MKYGGKERHRGYFGEVVGEGWEGLAEYPRDLPRAGRGHGELGPGAFRNAGRGGRRRSRERAADKKDEDDVERQNRTKGKVDLAPRCGLEELPVDL